MSVIDVSFKSESLLRNVNFKVILPIEEYPTRNFKTLYLLHGMFNDYNEWIRRTDIVSLSKEYGICIVMPSGDNSYYVNDESCHNLYSDYILELVEFTRKLFPLSESRWDTYIGGASMGGFGALYNGFRFNEIFSQIICFSPAIYHEILSSDNADNYRFEEVNKFLENKFKNDEFNLRKMVKNLRDETKPLVFMFCGNNDYLLKSNLRFKEFLEKSSIECTVCFRDGEHNWKTWDKYLPIVFKWLEK